MNYRLKHSGMITMRKGLSLSSVVKPVGLVATVVLRKTEIGKYLEVIDYGA